MKINLIIIGFLLSLTLASQPYNREKQNKIQLSIKAIENICVNNYQKHNIPGAAFGIVADSVLIYANYYGAANLEQQYKVDKETVFRIASMTKSFTAVAILQLRDAGKIQLDKPAETYYPLLKTLKYPSLDAPLITVRDLLTHSAGFPEDNAWGDRQLAKNDNDLIQLFENQISFSTTPQTGYEYSNLGFAILGKIISIVSGKPYQQYIEENIWKPLKMKNTYWEFNKVPSKNLAKGYKYYKNKWIEEEMLHDATNGSWGAMGAMLTTIHDFSRYISFHQRAYTTNNSSLVLKNSSLREMHQPWRLRDFNPTAKKANGKTCGFVQGYGYGLVYQKDCNGVEWVGHAGGLPGFGSQWRFLPQYGIAIIGFANRTYAPFSAINNIILDTLLSLSNLVPKSIEPSKILLQRQKEIVEFLSNESKVKMPQIFAENFFLDNPIEDFMAFSKLKFEEIGKIISIEKIKPENNLRGSFRVFGDKGNVEIYFTLTPEKNPLIQKLSIY